MINHEQAADIRRRLDALSAWLREHKRNSCKPEEIAHLNPPTNRELSALEVWEFTTSPPERKFLYVDARNCVATTWTGEQLGTCSLGREYRDNFGGKRRPITVRAINGYTYHGTYYASAGDYARVRKGKRIVRYQVEYTDTFGGEANYSWVHRHVIEAPDTISNTALMRRAKALVGLTGVKGRTCDFGDTIEFRPYRACTVLFVSYIDD